MGVISYSLFVCFFYLSIIYFKDCINLQRKGKGGRERERNITRLPLVCPQLTTWPCNPGTCPDWESNQQPLGSQASIQSTEPYQPGLIYSFNLNISPKMSHGMLECDSYVTELHTQDFVIKKECYLCWTLYLTLPSYHSLYTRPHPRKWESLEITCDFEREQNFMYSVCGYYISYSDPESKTCKQECFSYMLKTSKMFALEVGGKEK